MSVFAIRDYRYLFTAQIIALFGTGLATVALGLLAYELAGPDAGRVLGTALTIKMVLYVLIAPVAAAFVDRLPRKAFMAALDLARAAVVLTLPFVTEVWQVYVLVGVLQSASAAFTPTFQALIPEIVTDESDYTRALSASQVAYTMESLLSPVLAALALGLISFNWLFVGTSLGFVVSSALVLATRIPNARPAARGSAWQRVTSGVKVFVAVPQLRGVAALNLAVASAGAIVVVNTVNYVRDVLGGNASDVAWMLATSGGGTLVVALGLPRVLDRVPERTVMISGALVLIAAVSGAVTLATLDAKTYVATGAMWVLVGAGMALVVTPTGRVLRRSSPSEQLPEVFAAQFSLSHVAWLVTYPIAGWMSGPAGLTLTWSVLLALTVLGTVAALAAWPTRLDRLAAPDDTEPGSSHQLPTTPRESALAGATAGRVGRPATSVTDLNDQAAHQAEGTLAACTCGCPRAL